MEQEKLNMSVMTMTTEKDTVEIGIAGTGAFTIDWGDGSVEMLYNGLSTPSDSPL
jgi:hypothetical protein